MPGLRPLEGSRAAILRPFLGFARTDIDAWARAHGLKWIDDESNDDTARQRNFIRHRVLPLIEERFPAARATAARAAAHLAEAGALLAELARLDLATMGGENDVGVAGLRRLGPMRAKNALRSLLQSRAIPVPTAAQLDELYRQLVDASEGRAVLLEIQGCALRRYRGRVCIERVHAPVPADFREIWKGENKLALLELGGVLKFKPEEGRGLSLAQLRSAEVTIRLRAGGERLQPDARRPRRTLKNLFQERGIPPWQRGRRPVIYCGEHLVCVPGIGEDCTWQARSGEPGLIVTWEPLE
jgi:tRNA(Ile)-lysidine synthase